MNINLNELTDRAVEWAKLAGKLTLKSFQTSFTWEEKSDYSPVTDADREAERFIRNQIEAFYPNHGIIGEEFGIKKASSPITWVLDPIDGTKSFIHGVPLYTTLIGILVDNKPVIGVIHAPAVNETAFAAIGLGAFYNDNKTKVRSCNSIQKASFFTTELSHIYDQGYGSFFEKVHHECKIHRTWGDAYGHMKVAAGQADLMFDPILNIWDAAALKPIIDEAGGVFSDTNGILTIDSGNGFSCSPELFPTVISYLEQTQTRKHA